MQTVIRDPMSRVFGKELKMYSHTNVEVSNEIEGAWGKPGHKQLCRKCGTVLMEVPREGHVNSPFWVNERPDGMVLKACPQNCLERDADYSMKNYLEHRQFMKDGAESYKWEWDYNKFENGWILPDGKFVFCAYMEHLEALQDITHTPDLFGFVKFTNDTFYWGNSINQRQKDILFG